MRLHQLRLRAVGPFGGTEEIDFAKLGVGGLFLLDGPTGAGKSTVLDAITFALYGPGERAGDGRLHSQFAPSDAVPEVELEFSLRGVRQRITRSPEFTRPKRRGDGFTIQAARVHLERLEDDVWVSRSSNKAEVADMLADDLGLNREQFTQVVLLPQGEFMKFLRAGDDDRRVLLTRLFGTQLYDRITDELDRRRKVADSELADSDRTLRSRIAAAAEAAGLDLGTQDELIGADVATRAARFDEIAAHLDRSAAAAKAVVATHVELLATAKRAALAAADEAARARRFAGAVEAVAAHEQTRGQYEQAVEVVSAAERAEPVRPLLAVLDEADGALADATAELDGGGRSAAELNADAAEALRVANELAPLLAREPDAAVLASAVEAAAARLRQSMAALAELEQRERALPGQRDEAERAVQGARAAAACVATLRQQSELNEARCAALRELADSEVERDRAQVERERSHADYEQSAARYFELVERRLATIAAELAANLADGDECPVCGSPEHPHPARAEAGTVDPLAITAADEARRIAEQRRDAAVATHAEVEQRRATLQERAGNADLATLTQVLAETQRQLAEAELAAHELPALEARRVALDAESAQLSSALQVASAEHAAASAELATGEQLAAGLLAELAAAAAPFDTVAARVADLKATAEGLGTRSAAVARVDTARVTRQGAFVRAEAEALAAGFDSVPMARAAILPAAELDELRRLRSDWKAEADRRSGALTVAEFADLDPSVCSAARDAAWRAAASAEAELDQVEAAHGEAVLAAERAAQANSQFAKRRGEVERAQAAHAALAEDAAPVVHLARLAKGVAGNRRVNLTTYVLRQWFEQVVHAANARLAGMSSGRYELVRVDEGASKAERTGLTLQVLDHHTGEQRSPRSLSGGETFYTSLALALGLADVVRAEAGGVELDTLFIDEGFGSLDADTLDSVMEVIDELRGRGRTVGIVSHVSELKDRIAERVEVRRKADGSSTLRVIA